MHKRTHSVDSLSRTRAHTNSSTPYMHKYSQTSMPSIHLPRALRTRTRLLRHHLLWRLKIRAAGMYAQEYARKCALMNIQAYTNTHTPTPIKNPHKHTHTLTPNKKPTTHTQDVHGRVCKESVRAHAHALLNPSHHIHNYSQIYARNSTHKHTHTMS